MWGANNAIELDAKIARQSDSASLSPFIPHSCSISNVEFYYHFPLSLTLAWNKKKLFMAQFEANKSKSIILFFLRWIGIAGLHIHKHKFNSKSLFSSSRIKLLRTHSEVVVILALNNHLETFCVRTHENKYKFLHPLKMFKLIYCKFYLILANLKFKIFFLFVPKNLEKY